MSLPLSGKDNTINIIPKTQKDLSCWLHLYLVHYPRLCFCLSFISGVSIFHTSLKCHHLCLWQSQRSLSQPSQGMNNYPGSKEETWWRRKVVGRGGRLKGEIKQWLHTFNDDNTSCGTLNSSCTVAFTNSFASDNLALRESVSLSKPFLTLRKRKTILSE